MCKAAWGLRHIVITEKGCVAVDLHQSLGYILKVSNFSIMNTTNCALEQGGSMELTVVDWNYPCVY